MRVINPKTYNYQTIIENIEFMERLKIVQSSMIEKTIMILQLSLFIVKILIG